MIGDILNHTAMNKIRFGSPGVFVGQGATTARPTGMTTQDIGSWWFDTTLGYPVWWTGTTWHNGAGTAV